VDAARPRAGLEHTHRCGSIPGPLRVPTGNRWELDSNEAIKRSVQAGLGVGFVSRLVVADELERGELESFRIQGADPMTRSIYLLMPDGRDSTPSERAFITTLGECCAVTVAGCVVDGANGEG
jgi:DNA-binding transcriptional LysR family regulator